MAEIKHTGIYDASPVGTDYVVFQKAVGGTGSTRHAKIQDLPGGSGGLLKKAFLSLSSADILALDVVPKEIIPAPGAGKVILIINEVARLRPGATAYQTTGQIALRWGTNPSAIEQFGAARDLLLALTANMLNSSGNFSSATTVSDYDNAPLSIVATSSFALGTPLSHTLVSGGTGYVLGDTGRIDSGGGDALYVVDSVSGGGAVLTYHLTSPGTNYTVETNVVTFGQGGQPGVGTGFTVNVNSVTQGDGAIDITIFYTTVDV